MRNMTKFATALGILMALTGCDVDKTEKGEAPEIEAEGGELPEYEVEKTEEGEMPEVDVEGGELPEYDVDTADVEVGTEKKVVEVPEVDVEMPEEDKNKDKDN